MPAACITQESAEALPDAQISTIIHSFHEIGGLTTHRLYLLCSIISISISISICVSNLYLYLHACVYLVDIPLNPEAVPW